KKNRTPFSPKSSLHSVAEPADSISTFSEPLPDVIPLPIPQCSFCVSDSVSGAWCSRRRFLESRSTYNQIQLILDQDD
ncbi:hypothetical protein LINPERHAP1_LOCUS31275, partial [Linum perenne]